MKYYNPQKKSNSRRRGEPRFSNRDYRYLDFPERPERDNTYKKKKPFFNRTKIFAIATAVVLLIVASAVFLPKTASAQYLTAYEVLLCGKAVGIVDDPTVVDVYLEKMRIEIADAYNMDVTDQLEIEYNQIETSANHICPADVFTNLIRESIEVQVIATIIYVNDWPAAVVKTQEEADWILENALAPYEEEHEGSVFTDIDFVEDVRVEEGPADYQSIIDKETALHNLTIGPGIEDKWHIVATGDAIARIARKEGIKVSDIRIANPQLTDTDKIYPGDKLRVVVPKNAISIRFKEVIDRIQDKPYETEYIDDDTKFTTEKEVLQEGVNGLSKVQAEITYVNGIEVEYNLLEEEILTLPQNAIVKRGTKSVPKELTQASEGRMPMPLRKGTYYISSPFGPRKAPKPGASTFHKGIDMAAPTGTPIYASADGTVHFSGTASGYGLYIRLDHDGGVETRYGHCSQLFVNKGEKVKKGDLIGLVGSTGVSTGAHLHFEIRIDGVAVDPLKGV